MKTKISTFSYEGRIRLFWALVSIAVVSLSLYAYAVWATVRHTVARAAMESSSVTLEARVSELEFKDIALKNTVNLEMALARGFAEVKSPLYVSRSRGSLTLNTAPRQ